MRLLPAIHASFLPAAWQAAADAFGRGGPVMWPILACSLVALALVAERMLVFWRCNAAFQRDRPIADRAIEQAAAGTFEESLNTLTASNGPLATVLAEGLRHRDVDLAESLQSAADRLLDRLRHGLSVLDTIITVAPLLGILGTVTGIIRSFNLLSVSGTQEPAAVTGGIAEALITTAAGLIVAILALLPYNLFVAQVRRAARDLEQITHRLEVASNRGAAHAPGKRI